MNQPRSTIIIAITANPQQIGSGRTDLVRLPVGADSSLFGGWGVRI
jgi:hypothetical protein